MKTIYSANDLRETLWSKISRWITFNISHTYILTSNDGRKIFVDGELGIVFDKDTLETIKIKELE